MTGEGEGEFTALEHCQEQSSVACVCADWDTYTAMSARASMVTNGTCVVLEQGSPLPTGVEGGIGMAVGFLLACLWATFR